MAVSSLPSSIHDHPVSRSFYYQTLVISYVTLPFRNTVKVPEDRPQTSTARFHTKGKFTLEQATKAQRGRSCIVLLFLQPLGGGWWTTRPGRLTPGKDPVPIVLETGWAPEPVWTDAENLASTGIRSTDRPARSESLYRLNYSGRQASLHFCLKAPVLKVKGTWPLIQMLNW